MRYRQCILERRMPGRLLKQVSYIPERYAVEGRKLRLKNSSDQWENGWLVTLAGNAIEEPVSAHALIKGHRRATGDSQPRISGRS